MHERRIPEWLRHAPAPGVRGFATLAGTEAVARGILISVFPLAMYNALQDAQLISEAYFLVGVLSLAVGLMVPFTTRYLPRRWVYVIGASLFVAGSLLAATGGPLAVVVGLGLNTISTVITFVCFNAYVMDYIAKLSLGRLETSRLFYSALGWTIGPALGVFLYSWWPPVPFFIAACAAFSMMSLFLWMRLGNGKLITKATRPPANPLAYLPRFAGQPRLIAGWIFAVIRSAGWWVYIVYLPIYAIENGLGDRIAGIVLSLSNAALFVTPLMLRWMQKRSIRYAVRTGFVMAGCLFSIAGLAAGWPWVTVLALVGGSFFLILLDVSGGLPFLLAVKPSERTEMAAVYASFRDVSGILTPGTAWLVLLFAPVAGVFVASGASLLAAWALSSKLHPRLGRARIRIAPAE
ncbi:MULTISPECIES: MFS transporter [unclassified Yoonia]|uniref:MFS transporter n=1 Tax=unclassified Yoonia TaxID=2629118 RepID=UPI002AFEA57D|nr:MULTISPECIES: MFS transporter [unclassified Yoonia]